MVDWLAIKTEYITTNTSYRKLAQKYNVSYQAICHRSKDEGWIDLREQHTNKIITETLDAIGSDRVDSAVRLYNVTEKALQKIEAVIDDVEPKDIPAKSLKSLTSALKDIMDVLGVKSELDKQEQEARIANLRKQAEKEDGFNAPTLVVEGLPEEFKV